MTTIQALPVPLQDRIRMDAALRDIELLTARVGRERACMVTEDVRRTLLIKEMFRRNLEGMRRSLHHADMMLADVVHGRPITVSSTRVMIASIEDLIHEMLGIKEFEPWDQTSDYQTSDYHSDADSTPMDERYPQMTPDP